MSGLRNTDTERPEALLVGAWAKGQDTLLGQLEESFLSDGQNHPGSSTGGRME